VLAAAQVLLGAGAFAMSGSRGRSSGAMRIVAAA
jgi:hypothetical protein